MITKVKTRFVTTASLSALAVGLFTPVIPVNNAYAQTSYYWGNTQLDDSVSVNLNVLDNLGDSQNLPVLLNPRASSTTPVLTNELPTSSLASAPATSQRNGLPVSGLTSNVASPAPVIKTAPVVEKKTATAPKPKAAMPASSLVSTAPKTEAPKPVAAKPKAVEPAPAPKPKPAPAKVAEKKPEAAPKPVAVAPKVEPTPVEPKPVAPKPAAVTPAPAPTPTPAPEVKTAEAAPTVEAPTEAPKPVALTPAPTPKPAPVPEATPQVEEPAAPTQTAALTKLEDSEVIQRNNDVLSVIFDPVETDLPSAAESELDDIVAQMKADENLKLFLEGYAQIPDASPNQSRRMSLFRAISVRNYLVKQEIPSRRIKVRAFGDKTTSGNTDRVDVFFE